MRVYINRNHVAGPWGGGNRTIKTLHEVLIKRGHEPCYQIDDKIDVIYCHDPRPNNEGIRYENLLWVKKNLNIPIFQRVGDVFFHRGEEYTAYLKETVKYSDRVSFITNWAASFLNVEIDNQKNFVHNLKPPKEFFQNKQTKESNKTRLITHHWSTNPLKGFDFYLEIDKLLSKYNNIEFVYLGRRPNNFLPTNILTLDVKDVDGVKEELLKADVYVTASKFETGGNHVVEALASKLPILYHSAGGGICDLAKDFGMSYKDISEFEINMNKVIKNKTKVNNFHGTLEDTCNIYCDLMEDLIKKV